MLRRKFIGILGATALSPLAARAQQPAKPVVGFLSIGKSEANGYLQTAFHKGLTEAGYIDGQNVSSNITGPRVISTAFRTSRPISSTARSR
jgi:putative tryptophan/tyrosine transport system substrate-binding protein